MSINWPKAHWGATSEYQSSGWPFVVTGSVDGTPTQVEFPFVTRWIQVKNDDNSKDLRFGFSEHGVANSNSYRLSGGTNAKAFTPVLELKCASIWLRADDPTKIVPYSLIAGLTNVPAGTFPILSSSNGYEGIG